MFLFPLGQVPKNHDILREAYSLCYRLPVLNTDRFKEDFFNVSNLFFGCKTEVFCFQKYLKKSRSIL